MELFSLHLNYEENENVGSDLIGVFTSLEKVGKYIQGMHCFKLPSTISLTISKLDVDPNPEPRLKIVNQDDKDIPF